ncbi:MAG: protein BatD [Chitinophagaceae bacterium]|nr:protein BatD [Chitinophagaceae bacterium]
MKKTHFSVLVFLSMILHVSVSRAQARFSAGISPERIVKDEIAELTLTVENARDVQKITPPVLGNFIIISGPNQENGMSMINGDVKKYIALHYILKPKSPGSYTIPPTTAFADGVKLTSNPVKLQVDNRNTGNQPGGNAAANPFSLFNPFDDPVPEAVYGDNLLKKGEDPLEKIRKNLFVRLETDKTSCFVGEPVVATYKLYTRLKSESSMSKNPSFNGFSVIDLGQQDNLQYQREKLNGKEYNVYIIRKVQLYPLQSGTLPLETAEVDNTVHFIRSGSINRPPLSADDLFRDFADAGSGTEDHRLVLQSNPLSILVKPLPDLNKPADFKGAVGNFAVEATLEKNNFPMDDAGKLTLIVSGVGNLQLVTAPELSWPAGIDGFEPRIMDDIVKTTIPLSGKKIIEFPFTASAPGSYTIPSIRISFFNPKENTYRSVETKPLAFTVTRGTGKSRSPLVKDNAGGDSLLNRFFSNRLRVVSVVALMILCGLFFWLWRDRRKTRVEPAALETETQPVEADLFTEERLNRVQQNPLSGAESKLYGNEHEAFYTALSLT